MTPPTITTTPLTMNKCLDTTNCSANTYTLSPAHFMSLRMNALWSKHTNIASRRNGPHPTSALRMPHCKVAASRSRNTVTSQRRKTRSAPTEHWSRVSRASLFLYYTIPHSLGKQPRLIAHRSIMWYPQSTPVSSSSSSSLIISPSIQWPFNKVPTTGSQRVTRTLSSFTISPSI